MAKYEEETLAETVKKFQILDHKAQTEIHRKYILKKLGRLFQRS